MPETAWIAAQAVGATLAHEAGSDRGARSHLSNVDYALARYLQIQGEAVDRIVRDVFEKRCTDLYGETGLPRPRQAAREDALLLRRTRDEPKTRWIDGTPLNTFYTWALAQMFPEARFLHHVRAPHEVIASLAKFDRVGAAPVDHARGLSTWTRHAEAGWLTERALGADRVFRVDYRRMDTEPAALVADLLAFLNEPDCALCVNAFTQRVNSSGTAAEAAALAERLAGLDGYREAEALYETIITAQPVAAERDASLCEQLRAAFYGHVEGRTLIGE